MGFIRAGKCSRSLLFALLVSALVHLVLLANITYEVVMIAGESGIGPKNLQVLVKPSASRSADSASAKSRVNDSANEQNQRIASPTQKRPEPDVATLGKTFSPLVSSSRETMIHSVSPVELAGTTKPVSEETVVVKGAAVRETASVDLAGARHGAEEIRSYRIALASSARKFKIYPPMARERGIGGRSEVMVVLTPFGVPEVSLRASSGEPSLDQAALDMMQRSVRVVELPITLRNQRMELMLPVEFVPGS